MLNFDPTVNTDFGIAASLCDASGQRLLVSDRYAGLLQRAEEDLLRLPWQMNAHPDDLKTIALPFNRLVAAGEPLQQRCRMLRSDGQWLALSFRAVRSLGEQNGRVIIQTHVKVEEAPPDVAVAVDPIDALALAGYIRDVALQLGTLAGERRLSMLQHLLSLVSAEAGQELIRLLHEQRADRSDQRVMH